MGAMNTIANAMNGRTIEHCPLVVRMMTKTICWWKKIPLSLREREALISTDVRIRGQIARKPRTATRWIPKAWVAGTVHYSDGGSFSKAGAREWVEDVVKREGKRLGLDVVISKRPPWADNQKP